MSAQILHAHKIGDIDSNTNISESYKFNMTVSVTSVSVSS